MIREANINDVEKIIENNYNLAFQTENKKLNLESLRKGVENLIKDESKGKYFVYILDGEIRGQLMITKEWSDWRNGDIWWIQSVYVEKEYRKKGIFKELYEFVENIVKRDENICGLRLYVEKDNEVAKEVYNKMGMKDAGYMIYELMK